MSWSVQVMREIYRRELLPTRTLWWLAAGQCGIFGQFQSGSSSVFGLRYHLTKTISKHGGTTCRIDLKLIPLRTRPVD